MTTVVRAVEGAPGAPIAWVLQEASGADWAVAGFFVPARSRSVIAPHTPCGSGVSRAWVRQCDRTGQSPQIFLAAFSRRIHCPAVSPSGAKKVAEQVKRHRAWSCQSQNSVTAMSLACCRKCRVDGSPRARATARRGTHTDLGGRDCPRPACGVGAPRSRSPPSPAGEGQRIPTRGWGCPGGFR